MPLSFRGFSSCLPFAEDSLQLIQNLKLGKRVERKPWFKSDDEAIKCGFDGNKHIATLDHTDDSALDLLYRLIDDALDEPTRMFNGWPGAMPGFI